MLIKCADHDRMLTPPLLNDIPSGVTIATQGKQKHITKRKAVIGDRAIIFHKSDDEIQCPLTLEEIDVKLESFIVWLDEHLKETENNDATTHAVLPLG